MIGALIQGEIIEALEHGWIVIDDANASAMMLTKGGAIK
jgi:hypothetical protein